METHTEGKASHQPGCLRDPTVILNMPAPDPFPRDMCYEQELSSHCVRPLTFRATCYLAELSLF